MVDESLKLQQKRKRKQLLFYCCLIALPVIQFVIFYIVVNINSIILAFQSYDMFTKQYSFAKFDNFAAVLSDIFTKPIMGTKIVNSLILFGFSMLVGIPLAILFSYYIYKGAAFSGVFKVILFMPQIISSIVLVVIYKYFVEIAIPEIWLKVFDTKIAGLYTNENATFATVLFFNIWVGFGSQILIYVAAMYGINEAMVEAAKIDGISFLGELWHITIPSIFSTLTTFIVVGFTGLFTNQMSLYSFGAGFVSEEIQTIGYDLYVRLLNNSTQIQEWPELAAMGLIFTIIIMPFVFGTKYLLTKYGPSED